MQKCERDHAQLGHMLPNEKQEPPMTLCPIAIVSSCEKCPAFKICPLKGVIGSPPVTKTEKPSASAKPEKK